MKISFSIQAWEEYLYFQTQDKKNIEENKWTYKRYWKKWSIEWNR